MLVHRTLVQLAFIAAVTVLTVTTFALTQTPKENHYDRDEDIIQSNNWHPVSLTPSWKDFRAWANQPAYSPDAA